MTHYFKKIELSSSQSLYNINGLKGDLKFHYGLIRYFNIKDTEYINNINSLFKIPPARIYFVEGHGIILPHRDNGQASCINIYLITGNYRTAFWKPGPSAVPRKGRRYDHKTKSHVEVSIGYFYQGLELMDSFVAEQHEAYALNVNEFHSVDNPTSNNIRSFIQLQWDMSFGEMLDALNL
tara:strand:- start:142 stop:681 length:540 start_codon:yes stop_codon:yes gene_type:complete